MSYHTIVIYTLFVLIFARINFRATDLKFDFARINFRATRIKYNFARINFRATRIKYNFARINFRARPFYKIFLSIFYVKQRKKDRKKKPIFNSERNFQNI